MFFPSSLRHNPDSSGTSEAEKRSLYPAAHREPGASRDALVDTKPHRCAKRLPDGTTGTTKTGRGVPLNAGFRCWKSPLFESTRSHFSPILQLFSSPGVLRGYGVCASLAGEFYQETQLGSASRRQRDGAASRSCQTGTRTREKVSIFVVFCSFQTGTDSPWARAGHVSDGHRAKHPRANIEAIWLNWLLHLFRAADASPGAPGTLHLLLPKSSKSLCPYGTFFPAWGRK